MYQFEISPLKQLTCLIAVTFLCSKLLRCLQKSGTPPPLPFRLLEKFNPNLKNSHKLIESITQNNTNYRKKQTFGLQLYINNLIFFTTTKLKQDRLSTNIK